MATIDFLNANCLCLVIILIVVFCSCCMLSEFWLEMCFWSSGQLYFLDMWMWLVELYKMMKHTTFPVEQPIDGWECQKWDINCCNPFYRLNDTALWRKSCKKPIKVTSRVLIVRFTGNWLYGNWTCSIQQLLVLGLVEGPTPHLDWFWVEAAQHAKCPIVQASVIITVEIFLDNVHMLPPSCL